MKCSFCSANIPDGSELCSECGMILSLDGENPEVTIPEYTPNIFGSEPVAAPEAPVDSAFDAPITVPEYEPDKIVVSEEVYTPEENNEIDELSENTEDLQEAEDDKSDSSQENIIPSFVPPVYENAEESVKEEPVYEDISSVSQQEYMEDSGDEYADFSDITETVQEEPSFQEAFSAYDEQEGEDESAQVIVPVEDDIQSEPTALFNDSEELEDADDDGDTYVGGGKKSKTATITALCLLLVCLVVAGGYIVKKVFPGDGETTAPFLVAVATSTDVKTSTDANIYETTVSGSVEETTDSQVITTQSVQQEETTLPEETTTEPSTTEPSTTEPSTTEPSTTEPSTTKPTTTKPTTTKPSTTKPTTTEPSTTLDPNGINGNAEIKRPSTYLSESYMAYTIKKVEMVGKPSSGSDWIQNLGKGAEVKVLAKENGYFYVYSTRFGTYGWIKSSYVSESRPVEETTSVNKGTVSPDKNGSGEIMYTTYSLNLRKGPSTSYDVIKVIPINYQVKIIGYKSGVSGWVYVTDLVSGTNGWVSSEYLTSAQ